MGLDEGDELVWFEPVKVGDSLEKGVSSTVENGDGRYSRLTTGN